MIPKSVQRFSEKIMLKHALKFAGAIGNAGQQCRRSQSGESVE
jgi:hypothetical protein